ncbi:MAG: hypothetical protein KDE58_28025, partial [Caldilineaceae bacterium]|nr:hypothetical protein [Caldilineaceae bacterium]
ALLVNGIPTILYTTGGPGTNNHGLDFGFTQPATGQVDILNTAPETLPDPAALQIVKVVDGGSVSDPFTVTVTGPNGYNTTVNVIAGTPTALTDLEAGQYTVVEATPSASSAPAGLGWLGTSYAPAGGLITLISGMTGTVTVTNQLTELPTAPTGVLTVTKTVDWNGNTPDAGQQFTYTIEGPDGFTPINDTITDGDVMTYVVPLGVYTVTETLPGAGWVTTYTVDSIFSSTSGVVDLRGGSTQSPIAPAVVSGTTYRDFNSNGQLDGTDVPVADVTVTMYGPDGTACGSILSDVNGAYSMTPTCSGPWRVVFTGLPTGTEPSPAGTGNDTSTQFVTTSGVTGLDFAVNSPCDYCQENPQTVGPIYTNGLRSTAPTNASVVGFAYNASGAGTPATKLAENEDTGTLYGIAYDRQRELVYASAFLKRHADLGPNGGGAIYQIDPSLPAASATSLLIDINGVTGAADGIVIDTGATFVRDLGAANNPNTDANAFPLVGKWGLGDIEIDEATGRLYATNLNQRTLVEIDLATATVLNSFAIPNPGCATADERRPFGLGSQNGKIYVGVVCDTTLDAFVMALQPDGTFVNVVTNIPMNIPMPDRFDGISRFWLPWTNVYQVDTNRGAFRNTYPSPLLGDIDFDANGNMLLSFRDRFADQTAEQTNQPNGTFSEDIWGHSQILQACATGSGWTTGGACNVGLIKTRVGENASNTGGLASLKVAGSFITGVADPISVMQQGTARWAYGTADEIVGSPYVVDNGTQGPPKVAKGNGMGDLELLCDPAPIEIGNRVWDDLDGDGEQDAGEPGLNNLIVTLQTPTGSSTTTTSGDGNYYFTVDAYTAYTITVATPAGFQLTAANTTALDAANLTSNHAISDTI